MNFAGMNPLAIALAAVAAFLWAAIFRRVASTARGRTGKLEASAPSALGLFATMLLADVVMAWVLAGTLGHLGVGQVTLRNGLISALFVWAGFVATTLTVDHRTKGLPWRAVLADAAQWLGALLLMGAVIGGIGV